MDKYIIMFSISKGYIVVSTVYIYLQIKGEGEFDVSLDTLTSFEDKV